MVVALDPVGRLPEVVAEDDKVALVTVPLRLAETEAEAEVEAPELVAEPEDEAEAERVEEAEAEEETAPVAPWMRKGPM